MVHATALGFGRIRFARKKFASASAGAGGVGRSGGFVRRREARKRTEAREKNATSRSKNGWLKRWKVEKITWAEMATNMLLVDVFGFFGIQPSESSENTLPPTMVGAQTSAK